MSDLTSDRCRVLLVSGSLYQLNGTQRVIQTLARELVKYGFDLEVIIPQQPIANEIQQRFRDRGAKVAVSHELANLSDYGMRAVPAFARYLKSREASLVNVHSPGPHIPLRELLA